METETNSNEKYTQDGITFKTKEDWENYNNATKPSSDKVVLSGNNNTNQTNNEIKGTQTVEISNINIPFWSMVFFMVKLAIASIPAILILTFLMLLLVGGTGLLSGLFVGGRY